MITPTQLIRAKKNEITAEYNRVLRYKYKSDRRTDKQNTARELFENGKKDDLEKIKEQIDKYNEAINILLAVKNGTF